MVNLLNEEFQVKKPILQKYIDKIRVMKERFKKLEFIYIPKEKNEKADLLLKLRKLDDTNPRKYILPKNTHLEVCHDRNPRKLNDTNPRI